MSTHTTTLTYCSPRDFAARPDHLFRNDNGSFVDVTDRAGIVDREGRGLGVVAADFDGDQRIDLYVANDTTANYLFRNRGDWRFEEVGLPAGAACSATGGFQAGMGIACGDLDGDGLPDLAVTNFYGESTTFYRNLGGGLFTDDSAAVGLSAPSRFLLGFGIAFLDVDDDGQLDLVTANGHVNDYRPGTPYAMPAQLLKGGAAGFLADVTATAGAAWQVPRVGRGLAAGDLDNDGRLDLLIVAQGGPLAYLHNQTGGGHSVTLRLEGGASNRDVVGARVTIDSGGRNASPGAPAGAATSQPATRDCTSAWVTPPAWTHLRSPGRPGASIATATCQSMPAIGCARAIPSRILWPASPSCDDRVVTRTGGARADGGPLRDCERSKSSCSSGLAPAAAQATSSRLKIRSTREAFVVGSDQTNDLSPHAPDQRPIVITFARSSNQLVVHTRNWINSKYRHGATNR